MNYIDLFAGAGGLSEGFLSMNNITPIAHIEMDNHASNTLRTRSAFYHLYENNELDLYYQYVGDNIDREDFYNYIPEHIINSVFTETISNETIPRIFNRIDDNLVNLEIEQVEVIVGGPPCQAYSLAGRSARNNNIHDPRRMLYVQYMEFIDRYNPYFFVFENVPGLATVNEGQIFASIQELMEGHGYEINIQLLNSRDFGVLQNRERFIITGKRGDLEGINFPVYETPMQLENREVWNILSDLPKLQAGESSSDYLATPTDYLLASGIRTKEDVLTWHVARPHNDRDKEIYRLVIESWNRNKRRLLYNEIPEHLQSHKNTTSFLDRYKVVAGNSPYSHTILAHISKDGHYFIHPDVEQARSLSVREAARIQSFPDNYFFEGPRTSVFTQIGNAVPPLMSKGIATGINERLQEI